MFVFWWEVLLCASLLHAAPVSENFVVSVRSDVSVHTQQTATLPCWLSPQQSAEDLEVDWYHGEQVDSLVMLYKNKVFNDVSQQASYRGRVSFGVKDASSGGLKDGDVTLKVVNVTLADAGKYTCYVSSDQHHDRASVYLSVTQTGVPPLLTAVVNRNNIMNVSCESERWHPQPELRWFIGDRAVPPKDLVYSTNPSGMVSVHSWLLVSSSDVVSCSVGLSGEEAVAGRIRVETLSPQFQEVSESPVAGWVLFGISSAALLGVVGFFLFKKHRGKALKSKTLSNDDDAELEKLLNKDVAENADLFVDLPAFLDDIYVNFGIEKADNKFVTVKDNKLRDNSEFPDGPNVTCLTAVKGTRGFSSGKHYWEVSLVISSNGSNPFAPKQSWWIGVTSQSVIPKDCNLSPNSDNGFWYLSSSPNSLGGLQFSSIPAVFVGVDDMPRKIGVYLDYEGKRLAFYNVEKRRLIVSLPVKFTGEVFPLFNPGKGDQSPMEILHRTKDDEHSETGNATP